MPLSPRPALVTVQEKGHALFVFKFSEHGAQRIIDGSWKRSWADIVAAAVDGPFCDHIGPSFFGPVLDSCARGHPEFGVGYGQVVHGLGVPVKETDIQAE